MSIESVRTPDERFANLPEFDFAPNYATDLPGFSGLRLHYLDEGPKDAKHTFLCLHGEPTWAYLYRKMIPVFLDAGGRVVAPDFFGFGRSDKPVKDDAYSFEFHRNTLLRLIEHLNLSGMTLVHQDWGGILGLTLPMDMPERIQRMIVMNTALTTGELPPSDGFTAWKAYVASTPDLNVGALMKRAVPSGLSDGEVAAYDAPFVDASYKAGVRSFPELVPITEDMAGADVSRRAQRWLAENWRGQSFMAVGALDPVLGPPVMNGLRKMIPGCPPPLVLDNAGHFVQESGDRVARAALEAFG